MSRNHFHPIFSLSQFFRRALIDKISFWPHWKKAFNSYRANDDWTGEHQLKGKYHCHCDQMARLLDQYFNIYINETLRKVGLFFCQMLYKLSKCPKTFNILPKGRIAKSGQSDHFTTDLLFFFDWTHLYVEWTAVLLAWSNPNQSNRRSAIQRYFPPKVSVLCLDHYMELFNT